MDTVTYSTKHPDWVQISTPTPYPANLPAPLEIKRKSERSLIKQYIDMYELVCGGLLFVPTRDKWESQKCLWMFQGKPLSRIRESGIEDQDFIEWCAGVATGCGRLDYCVNIHHGTKKVSEVFDWIHASKNGDKKAFICRAKNPKGKIDAETKQIETIDIGMSVGNRFTTIYDKSFELGKARHEVIRVEHKERNKDAFEALLGMAKNGLHQTGRFIMERYAKFPYWDEYNAALATDESIKPEPLPEQPDSYEAWLNQVVSSVAKSLDSDDRFLAAYNFLDKMIELAELHSLLK